METETFPTKLSIIIETSQSIERDLEDGKSSSRLLLTDQQLGRISKDTTHIAHNNIIDEMEFEIDEGDEILRSIEKIAIKLDIHKTGTIFLKELNSALQYLSKKQKKPIADFLVAYFKYTKRITMPVPIFMANLKRAVELGKFGLTSKILKDHVGTSAINKMESVQPPKPSKSTRNSPAKALQAKLPAKRAPSRQGMSRVNPAAVKLALHKAELDGNLQQMVSNWNTSLRKEMFAMAIKGVTPAKGNTRNCHIQQQTDVQARYFHFMKHLT